jgi:hypothetical protein
MDRPINQPTNYLTNSMELSTTWEATSCAATQETPSILWNLKVPCRHGVACPMVANRGNGPQLWRVATHSMRSSRQLTRDSLHGWGLGMGLEPPSVKNKIVMKHLTEPWTWTATEHNKQWGQSMGTILVQFNKYQDIILYHKIWLISIDLLIDTRATGCINQLR